MSILVIKLGALGDFVLADSAFKAIREHHKDERIILLTTPQFGSFAKKLGYFDSVFAYPRFSMFSFSGWKNLIVWFREHQFSTIYDLQMVERTRRYYYAFSLFSHTPFKWIGHVKQSPYILENHYFKKHPLVRFERLLSKVGIQSLPSLDIRRLAETIDIVGLRSPYILLVPGASNSYNGAKKWPLHYYRDLTAYLLGKGYHVVVVGGPTEDHSILRVHDRVQDLTGQTTLEQVVYIASNATLAIGNDTGPMHIAAASGCPTVGLFSRKAAPASQVGACGPIYKHIETSNLNDLKANEVIKELEFFLKENADYLEQRSPPSQLLA